MPPVHFFMTGVGYNTFFLLAFLGNMECVCVWLKAVPVGCRSLLDNKEGVKSETHIGMFRRQVNESSGY